MAKRPLWVWDDTAKRYRETETGRWIGINKMQELRNEYLEQQKAIMRNKVEEYLANPTKTGVKQLNKDLREIIKQTNTDMYALGAGGRNGLSHRDWGTIGALDKEQYKYLNGLVDQIAKGKITPAQANARLKMYVNSSNEALWRGYTNELPKMPAYPGDGSTQCLTNCQCTWEIVPVEGGFNCYWRLGPAEHCDDCVQRAGEWNPLFIPYGIGL
jgi:hypothetical protein